MPEQTIADLLTLVTRTPGRPRVTWYGDDGERVELSGAVLENWVNKTTNLLVEEFDAGPGTRVLLDLPGHWRTVVWALAAWRAGACVVLDGPADVVVTTEPGRHDADQVVAVTLAALARRFAGALPPGAVDAASAVMTYGDVIGWSPTVESGAAALDVDGHVVPHRGLVAWSARDDTPPTGARTVLTGDTRRVLETTVAALAADGSVVVLSGGLAAALAGDEERRGRLLESERVDRDLL